MEDESKRLYTPESLDHAVIDKPTARKRILTVDHWSYRYLILFLVCIIKCIQNYIYEIPSGMESIIIQILQIDVARYSLLYTVYSLPNIILPLIGGLLVDRIVGIRPGILIFMSISLIGQLGFSLGGYYDSFIIMIISRFVIGIGSQMSLVISDPLAARWFKGKEIAFMFALIGTACRFGGIGGIYLGTVFYDWLGFINNKHSRLGLTLMISFGILLIATCTTVLLVILDKKGEKVLMKQNKEKKPSTKKSKCTECCRNFKASFWFICIMFASFFTTIFSFVTTSQLFFVSKFNLSLKMANIATIVSYTLPVIAPIIGILIDGTGYYISWGLFGGFGVLFGGHLLFCFSSGLHFIPFIGNAIIGLSYISFNTAMRIVPAILVSEDHLVTAYGLLEVFQSFSYSLVDLIVGLLDDNFGYFIQEIFLLCLSLSGIISGIIVVFFVKTKANEGSRLLCHRDK